MRRAVAILALLTIAACSPGGAQVGDAPVSVLLVTLDTTRPDHLGAYGYVRPTSPNLDALAGRGVRFEHAWSHAPETGPSLATVLTSRRGPVTGVRANAVQLDPSLPTLATVAKSAGRRTAAFVSTVLLEPAACGFERGFDVYDAQMTDPCFGHDRAQRIAAKTVDAAVAWLAQSKAPFLCWVHLYDPHGPYTPPEPTPRLDASRQLVPSSPLRREWIPAYQRVGDSLDAAGYVDRYDREIAVADAHLARLLAAVDASRTLVVLHADHGEALGEDRYWFRHGNLLHDAALHVPWIVAGPGVPAGRTVAGDVRLIDLAPTLLALASLPPLPDAEGNDLATTVRDGAAPPPLSLVAEARKEEVVGDSTGIDVRWKLRAKTPAFDVTLWPSEHPAASAARTLVSGWLNAPERAGAARTADPAIDDALRGLGYR